MLHPYSNSDVGTVSLMNSGLRLVRSARIFGGELKCKMLGPRATDISASIFGEKRPSDLDGLSATRMLRGSPFVTIAITLTKDFPALVWDNE